MRLIVAAIGRLKDGAERALLGRYCDRFAALGKRLGFGPVTWQELPESRAGGAAKRRADEAIALLARVRDAQHIIALDERGEALSSLALAQLLARLRDAGIGTLAILIGGPDGLAASARDAAHTALSFGAITLPHALARIVLAEQLYRAATILAGHPYHRGRGPSP
jgi:23S rRNA (pseudouridine1915-N3)-methyltransferase